ncbi:MAG: hypothetical protein IJ086_01210 [Clostridium sp.]|nr:hypothetical protein [Clostridium sp.]MBQ8997293.1 hypothetical protein [Clostridium sp.]
MNLLIDLVLLCIFSYILIKIIIDFFTKKIYIKSIIDNDIQKDGEIYINLYDYKKNDFMIKAIVKDKAIISEELMLNKNLIISLNSKEKLIYKYFKF